MEKSSSENKPLSDEVYAETWAKRCGVLFQAWVQLRYHRRRQRFFDLADKLTKAVTVVLGASLLGQYFRDALPWLATGITSLGLLSLVFGYGDRKQLHKELAETAAALIQAIEQIPAGDLAPGKVAAWSVDYARLCSRAPPPLKTLTVLCEREQATTDGHPDHVKKPIFWRCWVAPFGW